MLKNLTIRITSCCNSRCIICHTWKDQPVKDDLSPAQYKKLFSRPEFKEVEDLFISGGEPFCRPDLEKTIVVILKTLPKVSRLLVTSNGAHPEKTLRLLKKLNKNKKISDLRLAVSIEGDKKINQRIRGINSYLSAIRTLTLCKKNIPRLGTRILMTLTRLNCTKESLGHLLKLAKKTNSTLSFRPFYNSDSYHYNYKKNLAITKKQKLLAIDFINKNLSHDPFLAAEAKYLKTGRMPLMKGCLAGNIFADVRPDGSVYACLNSNRKIGDPERGIFIKKISDLGAQEQCPCCDEACFFPAYNYQPKNEIKRC